MIHYVFFDAASLQPVARVAIDAPADAETRDIAEALIEQNVIDKHGMFYKPEINDIDSFFYAAVNSYVYDIHHKLPVLTSPCVTYAVVGTFEPDKPIAYIANAENATEAMQHVDLAIERKLIPDKMYKIRTANLLTIKSNYKEAKRI